MLLSIIIPTKNRQDTCIYAIESALLIDSTDIEIIIQDCSESDMLGRLIGDRFDKDERIKYFFSDDNPSMTENWNRAISNSSGDYLCCIGDDDAVLPDIFEVARWALTNQIQAVVHTFPYFYFWPGYFRQKYQGTFGIQRPFSGKCKKKSDYKDRVNQYSKLYSPMGYMDLPSVYHALISRKLLDTLKRDTNKLLDSTSLDIYTAIAFSKYIDDYYVVDYPFTIKGASPKSNSQRLFTKKSEEHFSEFKSLALPDFLPNAIGMFITAAESLTTASLNTGRGFLADQIDLPVLYANIALENEKNFPACKKKLEDFIKSDKEKERFYVFYSEEKKKKAFKNARERVRHLIVNKLDFIYRIYEKLTPAKKSMRVQSFQANTIIEGIQKVHQKNLQRQSAAFLELKKLTQENISAHEKM